MNSINGENGENILRYLVAKRKVFPFIENGVREKVHESIKLNFECTRLKCFVYAYISIYLPPRRVYVVYKVFTHER